MDFQVSKSIKVSRCKTFVSKIINKYSTSLEKLIILNGDSMRECAFLSSLPDDIFGIINPLNITYNSDDNLSINLPYKGLTLKDWCLKNKTEDRIYYLPKIIYQLLKILYIFDKINVIHGDLKPENILIDSNNEITIIDFGSCILDNTIINCIANNFGFYNTCTYIFSSPEMLKYKDYITTKHDIFSLGLIIKYIILGKYTENENDLILKDNSKNYNSNIEKTIYENLDTNIKDLLSGCFVINSENRLSSYELLNLDLFKSYKKSYIVIDNIFDNRINIKKNYNRDIYINWIFKFCKKNNFNFIAALAVHIFDKYMNSTEDEECNLVLCSSLILADSLLRKGFSISINQLSSFGKIKEIKDKIMTILKVLNFNIYFRTFDYYLRENNQNIKYSIINDMLLIPEIMNKSVNEQITIYKKLKKSNNKNKFEESIDYKMLEKINTDFDNIEKNISQVEKNILNI